MSDENIASRVKLTLQTFDGRSTEDLMNAIGQHVRNVYESARAKDAELIQKLVNALHDSQPNHHEDAHLRYNDALDATDAAGFKPSEQ